MPEQVFDVRITLDADWSSGLPDDVADEAGTMNHEYEPVLPPPEAASWPDTEREMVERFADAGDDGASHEEWLEERWQAGPFLFGFDLGTNALCAALALAGCVPVSSCNAGAFGGEHPESHPLVAFFAPASAETAVTAAARQSGCGLKNAPGGLLVAYSDRVSALVDMAGALLASTGQVSSVQQPT
jgi:hypothetical protein